MILHNLRLKARDKASARWDNLALEVERLHDGAKLFCAVREITRKSVVKLTIHATPDALCGSTNTSAASLATQLWKQAIEKLNSGRASGHDDLPTELLKSTAGLLADTIAGIFSYALERQEPLETNEAAEGGTVSGRRQKSNPTGRNTTCQRQAQQYSRLQVRRKNERRG
ncbi:hypothetical protein LSAT2_009636 [Lamellibrachia satsuma]|nr:hypothetical protein LSAT2_009636 [Lamellibrachia satsuma]